MPLRDHFRPPTTKYGSWELLHGMWPVGQPLPTIPLWLNADLAVPLDLEKSYEQACHDLWIT